ncbi:hypothetical protein LOK49_LG07G02093 [Camellia lanceoleosa]|uniref:Uncharacterized protein n=1 Tax=Camellia lanceoleosa TaxID=1840588 RepID=A0ACC0H1U4_9ERIC|nr:hypothetical protein LOK49_LG07G02093 [Camellia lanceoleosa]
MHNTTLTRSFSSLLQNTTQLSLSLSLSLYGISHLLFSRSLFLIPVPVPGLLPPPGFVNYMHHLCYVEKL